MPRLPLLVLLLLVLTAPAVARSQADLSRVTLEELFTGKAFDGDDVPAIRWLKDGRHYTVLEASEADLPREESDPEPRDLVRYDAETGRRQVLVSAARLIPAGRAKPLSIDDYRLSEDAARLLVYTHSERVWRRDTRGDYWVLHLATAERVGTWGWSGGGSMTLNMLFRYPEIYHTGISVAPVPDQRLYDTIYQERYQGLPDESPEVYEQGSPITFAEHLEGNLLLIHGTGDDNVHYQGMEKLIDKLIAHNKAFTMMAYPNRSHGIFEGEGTSRHLYELMTRFLKANLPAGPV